MFFCIPALAADMLCSVESFTHSPPIFLSRKLARARQGRGIERESPVIGSTHEKREAMNPFAPVAVWGFWVLLVVGWWVDELRPTAIATFILLWVLGFAGLRSLSLGAFFLPYVALLDVALVLIVFKGDVKLR
jgi:hypothetical protein